MPPLSSSQVFSFSETKQFQLTVVCSRSIVPYGWLDHSISGNMFWISAMHPIHQMPTDGRESCLDCYPVYCLMGQANDEMHIGK